ncbi:helix-turn-helix domain-containing protein [Candidatus Woesearchaeota archaeon]|nr:helix-turn-helix domain-containing protein [Candidatus Woesearchaeota archaeon]
MAKKETFLMVSLEEEKAKKLAQVISNDTARKILDHLASKKATESELAKELGIPISTVHYNLKHLLASKLVEAKEYHYSNKGKEVLHYSLANKYVIIAPKSASESIRSKLKSIIPAIVIISAAALALQYSQRLMGIGAKTAEPMLQSASRSEMLAMDTALPEAASRTVEAASTDYIGLWFAAGAIAFLAVYLLADYLIKRYRK